MNNLYSKIEGTTRLCQPKFASPECASSPDRGALLIGVLFCTLSPVRYSGGTHCIRCKKNVSHRCKKMHSLCLIEHTLQVKPFP